MLSYPSPFWSFYVASHILHIIILFYFILNLFNIHFGMKLSILYTNAEFSLPLSVDSKYKQSDEVIRARVQVINYINVEPKK